ncbi:MAG TPA: YCF48-related protein [Flavobacteriales bacterium]|nr:YCF48-related protein [Flavobacteriales bacterium]
MSKAIKRLTTAFMVLVMYPASAQWTDLTTGITNDLNDVHFINNNEGWAVGRQGKIIHTTNAGSTWTLQNSGTTNDLNDVFMVNSTCGYCVGNGGKTLKYNGTTWSTLSIGFSQDMFGVHFLTTTEGWISGDWGRIMMTTDGGSSWTTQMDNSIYSNTFNDLSMISSSDGWAVGSSGRVLHYDGANWSNVSNPASAGLINLYSVSFNNTSNGFMTGESSKVYQWDGSSWNEHSTSLPDNSFHVYGVHTISNTLAYAATSAGFGGEGYILKYNGTSWITSYSYTGMGTELFTGIHFPSAGKGYCVANSGIVKTLGTASAIDENAVAELDVNVFPNPVSDFVNIRYNLEKGSQVTIEIFNLSGHKIIDLCSFIQGAGWHEFKADLRAFESGVYLVKIQAGDCVSVREVIK